ncbi:MAG TPA: type II secretion system protein GspM [Bryobacteraceae bacterium]|nr:type II secretion system protein GspM [Bryobacteraceae bacterium]
MKLGKLEVGNLNRRTLLGFGIAAVMALWFGVIDRQETAVVTPQDSVPSAEMRLERLRRLVSMVPGKEAELKVAQERLGVREKGMMAAETAAQAQAQLLEIVHKVAKQEGVDARGAEELRIKPLADDYGEVSVIVSFTCTIEQLVNLMAALANEPQLLATNEIRIASGNQKQKTIQVRLGLSAVVPKKLVPAKKGLATF